MQYYCKVYMEKLSILIGVCSSKMFDIYKKAGETRLKNKGRYVKKSEKKCEVITFYHFSFLFRFFFLILCCNITAKTIIL